MSTTIPVLFEPTDLRKARKLAQSLHFAAVTYASPNKRELAAMAGSSAIAVNPDEAARQCLPLLQQGLQVVVVTMGSEGVLVVRRGRPDDPLPIKNDPVTPIAEKISAVHYPCPLVATDVASVSGAGDCFAAAFVTAFLVHGLPQGNAVASGMQAATHSLRDSSAVPESLTEDVIIWTDVVKGNSIVL